MNHNQIVNEIARLLREHIEGARGTIHQEPYKGDIFRLFAAAFNAGLIESPGRSEYLSADALADILATQAPETVESESFHSLHTFWHEWTYAWRRRGQATAVA
jgi:hypothetical protein